MIAPLSLEPGSRGIGERREVSERLDAGEKEVSPGCYGGEGRQAGDLSADGTFGDFEFEGAVVGADDRVTFVAEFVKVAIVHPHVLSKLVLPNEARADDECGDAALNAVVQRVLRQVRAIRGAAADHAAAVHVRRRIAGIHPSHARAERYRIA